MKEDLITQLSLWEEVESVSEENQRLIIYVKVPVEQVYTSILKAVRKWAPGTPGEVRKITRPEVTLRRHPQVTLAPRSIDN